MHDGADGHLFLITIRMIAMTHPMLTTVIACSADTLTYCVLGMDFMRRVGLHHAPFEVRHGACAAPGFSKFSSVGALKFNSLRGAAV